MKHKNVSNTTINDGNVKEKNHTYFMYIVHNSKVFNFNKKIKQMEIFPYSNINMLNISFKSDYQLYSYYDLLKN